MFFVGEELRWGEDVMNYLVAAMVTITVLNTCMHQYRFVVARRIFTLMTILYVMRALTLAATPLPPSYPQSTRVNACDPRANETTWALVWSRVAGKLLSGGQAAGVCGDMLFRCVSHSLSVTSSGHTMLSTLCVLFTQKYTPRPHRVVISLVMWALLVATVVCLLISRAHYTVDIIFAYWLSIGAGYGTRAGYCTLRPVRHLPHVRAHAARSSTAESVALHVRDVRLPRDGERHAPRPTAQRLQLTLHHDVRGGRVAETADGLGCVALR